MPVNGSVVRGSASFTADAAAFGAPGRESGVKNIGGVDSFLVSGGTLTTGTVECWVKTMSTATAVLIGHDAAYWIGMIGGQAHARYGSPDVTLDTTTTMNDGQWHHLRVVLSAGTGRFYVDGVQAAASASVGTSPAFGHTGLTIGGFPNGGFDWTGAIDEVRVSTTARSTGGTFALPTTSFANDANTAAKYHLDGHATDTAESTTGDGQTGPASRAGQTVTQIAPNAAGIVYSPYNWRSRARAPRRSTRVPTSRRWLLGTPPRSS